jgi:dsRNA-specific ribonuclease
MADDKNLVHLQEKIGYSFTDIKYLKQALKAAGAEINDYDGNRELAKRGESLLQGIVVDKTLSEGASRRRSPAKTLFTL